MENVKKQNKNEGRRAPARTKKDWRLCVCDSGRPVTYGAEGARNHWQSVCQRHHRGALTA